MATTVLNGLGQALRWLRDRLGKKQYQVAEAAGITKGMLSAYETGRQRPSLETLEKLLNTLGCDLHDLHNAIQIVNGRPAAMRPGSRFGEPESAGGREHGFPDLYSVLGQSDPLPPELERAFGQLLDGFHKLIRYMHRAFDKRPRGDESPTGESS
ncbi:MAG TPA: helix-turn-helix transcriptional regulator [Thermoanaerobaculia bacterium]|nr:helix-turn-helix transcriptional regulator [Thermoanaerobaculia bacterium]